jgi:homoserine O-acetyltransferase/O-succinyltransferase
VRHPPLAPGHVDAPHGEAALGDLALESGEAIRDFRQSYATHGTLDAARSNAILVCVSLTGTHHRLDFLVGPGKALDTDRFFVVAADAIGNGLTSSPSNSTLQPGARFPRFVLRDMVSAQHRLLTEVLGVERLHAVVGASMGGMQALQWGVSHPGFMRKLVAMTPMARTAPWAAMVVRTARACLMADPAWNGSEFTATPERGWRAYAHLMTALVTRTPAALAEGGAEPGSIEAWAERAVATQAASGFDAHDYLYQSWAYESHDVGATPGFAGNLRRALGSIRAATLVLAPPLDLFNPESSAREAAAAIPGARFVEIPSIQGHQAATSTDPRDASFLNAAIREFLAG